MNVKTLIVLPVLLAALLFWAGRGETQSQIPSPLTDRPDITGYTQWTKVNDDPHFVFGAVAALCAPPPSQQMADQTPGPHKDKWVNVYINPIGARTMRFDKTPVFPVGTIIVKQKLANPDSKSPELLTVMRKREKGYNPSGGDWEYSVCNGTGAKLRDSGRLSNCQSCHAQWKATDYVSRAYFTDGMLQRLH